jgi:hypothetical protein
MALTTGPLMSLDASGSVAKTIVFSKWKGRNYVRQLVTPANPKSDKQVSVRAMFKFLSEAWAFLTAPNQGTWDAIAASLSVSPFNAYVRENQSRWGSFLAPGKESPVGTTGTAGTLAAQSATGGVGQATLTIDLAVVNDNWNVQLHRSTSIGFTPSFSTLIGVVRDEDLNVHTFVDTPLAADTYYYRWIPCTDDGLTDAAFAEINAIVT